MTVAFGLATVAPPSQDFAAIQSRLAELDARIRSIDPSWAGLGAGAASGTAGANGSFQSALATMALDPNLAISAAPTDPAASIVQPVAGATVTQPFGPTSVVLEPAATVDGVSYAHYHDGLDLAAPLGTPVRAAAAGTVTSAGPTADGAVVVCIRHADGTETRYGHLATALDVKAGDRVAAGQRIGSVGLTGNTTGPHVHFELWSGGRAVDPAPWLASGGLRAPTSSADARTAAATAGGASDPGTLSAAGLARFDAVAAGIPYAARIRSAAVSAGIDPLLFASLVASESGFRPTAVSSAGAQGLTQLMPATSRWLGVTDPFDPGQNLDGGARYLAEDLRMYGRTDLALAAYQAGKGAVAAAGGVPDYPSTRNYIASVLGSWSRYLGRSA